MQQNHNNNMMISLYTLIDKKNDVLHSIQDINKKFENNNCSISDESYIHT